jgi:hypothetical protein
VKHSAVTQATLVTLAMPGLFNDVLCETKDSTGRMEHPID